MITQGLFAPAHSRRRGAARWLVLLLGGLLGLFAAAPTPAAAPLSLPALSEYNRASMAVAEAVRPAVVLIESEATRRLGAEQPRPTTAEGSGVIIDPEGFVLTNRHLVSQGETITIHLSDGEDFSGRVVGEDAVFDLAVVRVTASRRLPAALLGNSDEVRAGEWVMAIGYPFGDELDSARTHEASATVGIISATGRQIQSDTAGQTYRGLLQTDASINPGNSGGPLVNSRGEVIGLNQAIYTPSAVGANVGVGFAVPINTRTKAAIRTIMAGGTVTRGSLGMAVSPLTPEVQRRQGVSAGVLVSDLEQDGPAAKAGVHKGDVIVGYGTKQPKTPGELIDQIYDTAPGSTVALSIVRDHRPQRIVVTVGNCNCS